MISVVSVAVMLDPIVKEAKVMYLRCHAASLYILIDILEVAVSSK